MNFQMHKNCFAIATSPLYGVWSFAIGQGSVYALSIKN